MVQIISAHHFGAELKLKGRKPCFEVLKCLVYIFQRTFNTQFNVPAPLGMVHAWQAEHLDQGVALLNGLHQWGERGLHGTKQNHRLFDPLFCLKPQRILFVQYLGHHRPSHDWETRHKMHRTAT